MRELTDDEIKIAGKKCAKCKLTSKQSSDKMYEYEGENLCATCLIIFQASLIKDLCETIEAYDEKLQQSARLLEKYNQIAEETILPVIRGDGDNT